MEREYCLKCMQPNGGVQVCPHCGYESQKKEHLPHVLRPGTVLNDRYLLGLPLGQGGFGITYIGRDLKLDMRVAVKEYYPSGYANRNVEVSDRITITDERLRMAADEGKNRFLKEARAMARFHGTPGIVDVRDYFEANSTAYIIMEYLEGEDLAHRIRKQLFSADEIFHLMSPILDTLEKIHRQDVVHRDISPDNIMMLPDGSLKLMDFGAARIMNYSDQRSMSVMLKAGYAPVEQYRSRGQQGPWTDIYALCATIYKCITGKTPEDALERAFEDELKWPSELGFSISVRQEAALKKGMAVHQQDRFQSISELKAALAEGTTFSAESAHITESRLTEEPPQAELDHPDHTAWIGSSSKPVTTSPKRLSEQRIEPQNDALHVSSKAASDLKPVEPKEASVYPEQERQVKETEKKKATPLKAESKAKKQSTKKKSRVIWVAVLGLALAAIVIWVVIGENRSKRQVTADAVIPETVQATSEPTMRPNNAAASPSQVKSTIAPSTGAKGAVTLTMGAGAVNEYSAFGEALSSLIARKTSGMVKIIPQCRMISSLIPYNFGDEYQLGLVKSNDLSKVYHGDYVAGENTETVANMRALAALYAEPVLIFTNDPSIKTVSDISDQAVFTNWTSSDSLEVKDILDAIGVKRKQIETLIPEKATQQLGSDVHTVVIVCGGYDDDAAQFFANDSVHLVSIGEDQIKQIIGAHPYYEKYTIARDVYSTAEDYHTIAVKVTLVADVSVSDDIAYTIASTIYENKEEIAAVHAKGAKLDVSLAKDGIDIPFHPGAERYYQEKGANASDLANGDASYLEAYNTAQAFSAKRYVAAGDWFAVGIKTDGTCIVSGRDAPNLANWKNMVSICASCDNVMGLQSDGKVRCTNLSVGRWTDIRQIDYFTGYIINDGLELYSHGVGLKADGTVVAAGLDRYNECAVETWTGIIDIAAGGRHTVGLKADGTVIATGNNEFGQCNTESWKNIVDVTAANNTTYGLSADGIIYVTGQGENVPQTGKWADVVSIIAGYECGSAEDYIVGILSNGKLVANRDEVYVSEKQVDCFSNVISVATASWGYFLCVDESGACSSIGPDIDGKRIVETWPAIKTK